MFEFLDAGVLEDLTITGFDMQEIEMMFTAAPPPPELSGGSGEGKGDGKHHVCPSCGEKIKCEKG
jgi:hypothetical protein